MKALINQPDLGILFFRLFIGLTMAFAHGVGKLPPSEQLINGVTSIGFPLPIAFAWGAALSEFLGGLFIAGGLFTRYASIFLGFTMAVAGFVVHGADPFQKKELALMYLAACVLLFLLGPGKYSLDNRLNRL